MSLSADKVLKDVGYIEPKKKEIKNKEDFDYKPRDKKEDRNSEKIKGIPSLKVLTRKEDIRTNPENNEKYISKWTKVVTNVTNSVKTNISIGNEGLSKNGSENEPKVRTIFQEDKQRGNNIDLLNMKEASDIDVLHVINVTDVTNVTDKEDSVTNVTRNIVIQRALGSGNLELILTYFFKENKPLLLGEVSDKINKTEGVIRTTINRNKEYFQEVEKKSGKKLFELSVLGLNYCKVKLDNYERKIEVAQRQLIENNKKELDQESLIEETKKIIIETNPKRELNTLLLDFREMMKWNPEYTDKLLSNPIEVIDLIKEEILTMGLKNIRIKNLPTTQFRTAESLRCKDIDELIVVEGRCVSLSSPRPIVVESKYECPACGTIISIIQTENKVQEPSRCSCGRRGGFKLLKEELQDAANIVIEDLQDNTDNPNTQRINARIQNWLVENNYIKIFNLGDEVRVTGILRTVRSFNRGVETINRGYLFEILDAEKKEEEIIVENFTDEEITLIKEMACAVDKEGMKEITDSFAPDVYGYIHIKNAIILQACNKKNKPESSSTRNKPNILLIGDPGIAKSVICNYAVAVTPGSHKASGGGSSAVGITASVVKEDESMGGYRIEAGALPLAKELLFLDEMNNLSDDDKPKLQEAMSEQMISINKANLHVNLKVTAGVLAAANPKNGHFHESIPYNKQFNIPSPILNRFDSIFIMKDIPNEERDEAIADIMIKRQKGHIKPKYSIEELKKFFAYVRNSRDPEVSEDITNKLKSIYSYSRKNRDADVIINPRFMEALSRMIEASAKMRLSSKIEVKDIKRAMRILKESHFKVNEYKQFEFGDKE